MNRVYKEILESKDDLDKAKINVARKYHLSKVPKNIELLIENPLSNIKSKPSRTISGVTPVAIMTMPMKCPHGTCTFCPGGPGSYFGDVPQSYTGNEPASMRAIRNNFDPYLQVFNRLEQYALLNHNFEKCEIIIMSGTFLSYLKDYKEYFIKFTYKAFNDFSKLFFINNKFQFNKFKEFFELDGEFRNLERIKRVQEKLLKIKGECYLNEEQLKNETSNCRVVALCIETKPDYGKEEHINELLNYGTTRVEIGVQSLKNEILKFTNRGHTVEDTIESTRLMKDSFLKITYHTMPGLPMSNREDDINMFKKLFLNQDYKPDSLKIYPCLVMPGTGLYGLWKLGKFTPITLEEAADIISEAKKFIPKYCRIMRIQRDIPTKVTSAGVNRTNLRQYVDELVKKKGIKCKCIRCREPRNKEISWKNVKILNKEYEASLGKEIFISKEDVKNDILLGFARLRIPYKPFRKEITSNSAGVRELHVYGQATSLDKKGNVQHQGIGKELMNEAEKIAKEKYNIKKLLVISGIGVKEYYKNLGYKKDGVYVSKILS
jgi:elongator complex protein 3